MRSQHLLAILEHMLGKCGIISSSAVASINYWTHSSLYVHRAGLKNAGMLVSCVDVAGILIPREL